MTIDTIGQLETVRTKLLLHPIYKEITTPERVKVFMKHHIFAVWDFMSLLKRLQRSVTCVELPWFPYEKALFSRLINEIVVTEESDIDGRDGFISHYELYLEAMDECGADSEPFKSFAKSLKEGINYKTALAENTLIRNSVKDFVAFDLELALTGDLFEVAAVFFYGREGLIPEMFQPLVDSLKASGNTPNRLIFYLNRHIEVDDRYHGPLAKQLFMELCENDPKQIKRANEIGVKCLETRMNLWTGVLEEIKEKNL